MALKTLFVNDVDALNYKQPCMYIGVGYTCSRGCPGCQNEELKNNPSYIIEADEKNIVKMYITNPVTHAIVFAGLEPLEDLDNTINWIKAFREYTDDPIIIYTGAEYGSDEIKIAAKYLHIYPDIIIKCGGYREGHTPHYDEMLGVMLASDNQKAYRVEELL